MELLQTLVVLLHGQLLDQQAIELSVNGRYEDMAAHFATSRNVVKTPTSTEPAWKKATDAEANWH